MYAPHSSVQNNSATVSQLCGVMVHSGILTCVSQTIPSKITLSIRKKAVFQVSSKFSRSQIYRDVGNYRKRNGTWSFFFFFYFSQASLGTLYPIRLPSRITRSHTRKRWPPKLLLSNLPTPLQKSPSRSVRAHRPTCVCILDWRNHLRWGKRG